MYTSRKVRRALQGMSDGDFAILLDDLDPEARGLVEGAVGRTAQAEALTRHYDEVGRSLGALVGLIREIAPNADL
jgi:hypothetical protein